MTGAGCKGAPRFRCVCRDTCPSHSFTQADGPRMQATFVDFDSGAQLVYTGRDQKRRKSDSSARDLGPLTDEQRAVVVETVTQSRLGSLIASIHGQSQQPGATVEVLEAISMRDLREMVIRARDRLFALSQSKGIPEAPDSMAYFAAQRLGGHMLDLIDEAALSQSTCWVDPTFKVWRLDTAAWAGPLWHALRMSIHVAYKGDVVLCSTSARCTHPPRSCRWP